MSKYGDVAVRAATHLQHGACTAIEAWRIAASEVFPADSESFAKSCPRQVFIGLYEAGLIRGAQPSGTVPAPASANRRYAIAAAHILATNPPLAGAFKANLWRRVLANTGEASDKQHNSQTDVVLNLRDAGFLA